MNYQPFLEMNLLVSDPLLSEFNSQKPQIILFLVLMFYLIFILHMLIYSIYRSLRAPKRNYPAHTRKMIAND